MRDQNASGMYRSQALALLRRAGASNTDQVSATNPLNRYMKRNSIPEWDATTYPPAQASPQRHRP
jgi:hypothetical protein